MSSIGDTCVSISVPSPLKLNLNKSKKIRINQNLFCWSGQDRRYKALVSSEKYVSFLYNRQTAVNFGATIALSHKAEIFEYF